MTKTVSSRVLELPQRNLRYRMIGPLAQNNMSSLACRQNILTEVHFIDVRPDSPSNFTRLFGPKILVVMEVRARLLERRALQDKEAIKVPGLDVRCFGVQVDGKVEEIGKNDGSGPFAECPGCNTLSPSKISTSGRRTFCH